MKNLDPPGDSYENLKRQFELEGGISYFQSTRQHIKNLEQILNDSGNKADAEGFLVLRALSEQINPTYSSKRP